MKTLIQCTFIFLMLGMLASCKSDAKKTNANPAAPAATSASGDVYKIAPGAKVNWMGRKLTGGEHKGTIDITGGQFQVANNTITGGNFTIDMNSINCTDLDEKSGKTKLEGHLKSADFFDVGKYSTAKFEVTKVVAIKNNPNITHNIFGNLTLKDVTKNIGFNTKLAVTDSKLICMVPNFKIDRTAFNVKYNSSKLTGIAKDKIILDEIQLGIAQLAAAK